MKKILVTGGAGFIASNITKMLLEDGYRVISIDNFSLGKKEYIKKYFSNSNYEFFELDLLDIDAIKSLFSGVDLVIHLAANSDISKGAMYTDVDLRIGTLATYNILEAMRLNNVKQLIFASTSAIYGIAKQVPTEEDAGPLHPISLYGASKLACEGLISAFSHNYGIQARIYRFGNVIGKNATHGAAYDFVRKIKKNPTELTILGNGKQAKPYIYIDDLISGIFCGYHNSQDEVNYFNLSTSGKTCVTFIAENIIKHIGLKGIKLNYTGGAQGWKGDVPQVELDNTKLLNLGWKPKYTSEEAVIQGTKDIVDQIYFGKEL